MSPDRISKRALNRALLARQLLLDRSDLLMTEAVEHLVGLQAQVPITPYIGLWSRLRDFDPMALSDLLLQRWAVRAALMRSTLHLISARDLVGLQPVMADVLARTYASTSYRKDLQGLDLDAVLAAGRELVAERPRTRAEIARLLAARWPDRSAASIGQAVTYLLPLVQVTPRGLWGSTQAATWALADAWLEQADRADHRPYSPDEIVLRYLAAFGPSSSADVRAWSGMTGVREVVDRLRPQLRTFRDEGGRELFDLPDAPRPLAGAGAAALPARVRQRRAGARRPHPNSGGRSGSADAGRQRWRDGLVPRRRHVPRHVAADPGRHDRDVADRADRLAGAVRRRGVDARGRGAGRLSRLGGGPARGVGSTSRLRNGCDSAPPRRGGDREDLSVDMHVVILDLLAERGAGATICPSDAARRAYDGLGEGWRALMQPVRDAAASLVDEGAVEVTQGGLVVDIRTARGPVRIRRRPA